MLPESELRNILLQYIEEYGREIQPVNLAAFITDRTYEKMQDTNLATVVTMALSVIYEMLDGGDSLRIRKYGDVVFVESHNIHAVNLDPTFPVQDAICRFANKVVEQGR
jgi:hypothetical protein